MLGVLAMYRRTGAHEVGQQNRDNVATLPGSRITVSTSFQHMRSSR